MNVLTLLENAVLAQIDEAELVALVSDLVRIESLGGNESPVQRRVATHMEAFGLDTDVWQIDFDTLSGHPGFSIEINRSEGLGVVGSMGSGNGPTLMLNGHVDVVPPGVLERWSSPPFEPRVEDGFLYGRGALDMKGGLACGLLAAAAIRRAGVRLSGRLLVSSVIGEEDGGVGTLASIERGYRADGAIVMEPTGLSVATAQAGCNNFRLRVRGRAAHGALRTEGVSALEKLVAVLQAIKELEARRNRDPGPGFDEYDLPFAVSVGRIEGGSWASSVPEEVVVEGRYGLRVGESPADARRELEDAVSSAAIADSWLRDHPPEVEWWGGRFHAARTDADADVVTSLLSSHQDQGSDPTEISTAIYGADMGLLVEYGGIPTVLYGPGDIRLAHGPDEAVPIAELVVAARTLALTAVRFCGAES